MYNIQITRSNYIYHIQIKEELLICCNNGDSKQEFIICMGTGCTQSFEAASFVRKVDQFWLACIFPK